MTEPSEAPRRGRRARALSPEETAEREALPGMRKAVASPPADTPAPALRRFGRRARVTELSDTPEAEVPAADRDRDGVELGELAVSEAPDPRPAPRFDGRVLHRPERSGGRSLLWLVWALVAVAVVALIILLLTGMLGGAETGALVPALSLHAVPDLEEAFA